MTGAEVGLLNDWATQVPLKHLIGLLFVTKIAVWEMNLFQGLLLLGPILLNSPLRGTQTLHTKFIQVAPANFIQVAPACCQRQSALFHCLGHSCPHYSCQNFFLI